MSDDGLLEHTLNESHSKAFLRKVKRMGGTNSGRRNTESAAVQKEYMGHSYFNTTQIELMKE